MPSNRSGRNSHHIKLYNRNCRSRIYYIRNNNGRSIPRRARNTAARRVSNLVNGANQSAQPQFQQQAQAPAQPQAQPQFQQQQYIQRGNPNGNPAMNFTGATSINDGINVQPPAPTIAMLYQQQQNFMNQMMNIFGRYDQVMRQRILSIEQHLGIGMPEGMNIDSTDEEDQKVQETSTTPNGHITINMYTNPTSNN